MTSSVKPFGFPEKAERNIDHVRFGVMSPKEIIEMSTVEITNSKNFGDGSVYDKRMGYDYDTDEKCVICSEKKKCTGHFGYIRLPIEILHPLFHKYIVNMLKCFCKECSSFLLQREVIELLGIKKNFSSIQKECEKIEICVKCSSPQPVVTLKDQNIKFTLKGPKKSKKEKIVSEKEILKIFNGISEEDLTLFGINSKNFHPSNLILTVLPVIPTLARPYVKSGDKVSDDDITFVYIEIMKLVLKIVNPKDTSEAVKEKNIQMLKFRVQTLMSNKAGKAKHPTDNRPLKSIRGRAEGKDGRIRGNLMGKRVDFSARTPIGADPTLKLDCMAIPREVANILTKPVKVTVFNIEYLTALVNNNGAASIITVNEKTGIEIKKNLKYALYKTQTPLYPEDILVSNEYTDTNLNVPSKFIIKSGIIKDGYRIIRNGRFIPAVPAFKIHLDLKVGDIVNRYLQNGDVVLLNRQPTLHRGSMMAMKIFITTNKTFQFNLALTKTFNADFDGDEMNIHVPQTEIAENELLTIANPKEHIISARESNPIIVIKQDSLIGAYLMTIKTYSLTRDQFMNILMSVSDVNGNFLYSKERMKKIRKIYTNENEYNGRMLFSFLFPVDFSYEKENSVHPTEPIVKIKKGVFISGGFSASILGSDNDSIIQILNNEYGSEIAANFIDNVQFMTREWLMIHGFSIGLYDCMITDKKKVSKVRKVLQDCYIDAEITKKTIQNEGIREAKITGILGKGKDIGMRIAKDAMDLENNFLVTVKSGAKGDWFNIAQITGLLAQQNLGGHRVLSLLNHGTRTLIHYPKVIANLEMEYESKGFVKSSFIHGLNPSEFFFHAMTGRESVSATAVSTADTGYLQRRFIKATENIKTSFDRTTRDVSQNIYSYSYNCGIDPLKTIVVDGKKTFCNVKRVWKKKFYFRHKESVVKVIKGNPKTEKIGVCIDSDDDSDISDTSDDNSDNSSHDEEIDNEQYDNDDD